MNPNQVIESVMVKDPLDAIVECVEDIKIGISTSLYIPKDCLEKRLGSIIESPEFRRALYSFSKEIDHRIIIDVKNSKLFLLKPSHSEAIYEIIRNNLNSNSDSNSIKIYLARKRRLILIFQIGKDTNANCRSCYFLNKSENICLLYNKPNPKEVCNLYTFYNPVGGLNLSNIIEEIYSLANKAKMSLSFNMFYYPHNNIFYSYF